MVADRHRPAFSAAWITVEVQSWCWVSTSTSWDERLSAAACCLPGSHHDDVLTVIVSASGLTDCAPRSKALMLAIVCGIGKA